MTPATELTEKGMAMAKKLCKLAKRGKLDQIGELARNARYICKKCGRTAEKEENLCRATPIEG